MPVILQDDQIGTWLDLTISEPQKLSELFKAPPPEDFLDCYPVKQINSVRFDEAEYAEKVDLEYLGLLRIESSNQE